MSKRQNIYRYFKTIKEAQDWIKISKENSEFFTIVLDLDGSYFIVNKDKLISNQYIINENVLERKTIQEIFNKDIFLGV